MVMIDVNELKTGNIVELQFREGTKAISICDETGMICFSHEGGRIAQCSKRKWLEVTLKQLHKGHLDKYCTYQNIWDFQNGIRSPFVKFSEE